MRFVPRPSPVHAAVVAALVSLAAPGPAAAQTADASGVLQATLVTDIGMTQEKIQGLAEAMSEDVYAWRPADGVRSSGEVLMHVAAANYLIPTLIGIAPPDQIAERFSSPAEFETITDREMILEHLAASFGHLRDAVASVPDARLDEAVNLFGTETDVRGTLLLMATHLHEHLGQLIAYARSNGVVPPWSR